MHLSRRNIQILAEKLNSAVSKQYEAVTKSLGKIVEKGEEHVLFDCFYDVKSCQNSDENLSKRTQTGCRKHQNSDQSRSKQST